MAIFFYSAYVLGAVLWQETASFSGDYCTTAGKIMILTLKIFFNIIILFTIIIKGLCAYTLMRLTFYDGEGFDFFITIWSNGHQFLFFITGVYLCSTAFGLLNGLVGIFASSFTSGTIENKYDDIDLLPKKHKKTGKYRNIVGAVACALCPVDPEYAKNQALHPSLTKAYIGEIAEEVLEIQKNSTDNNNDTAIKTSTKKNDGNNLFEIPKSNRDPRNRSHSTQSNAQSVDETAEDKKEEDFKKIVVDMFKELNTERTILKNKLQNLETIVVDLKAESSVLLELIRELKDSKKESDKEKESKHELSGKDETKTHESKSESKDI
jgi:hypothetical protein